MSKLMDSISFRILSTSLLISVAGALLVVYPYSQEPSLGLFLFFQIIFWSNLFLVNSFEKNLKLNILSVSSLVAFQLITFGFILNTKNHFINVLLLIMVLIFANINLLSDRMDEFFMYRYVKLLPRYIASKFYGIFETIYGVKSENSTVRLRDSVNLPSTNYKKVIKILGIFVFIGLPILLLVLSLLSSSSSVFAEWVGDIFNVFNIEFDFGLTTVRVFFVGFLTCYLVSEYVFLKYFFRSRSGIEDARVNFNDENRSIGNYVILILVVLLNLFYVLFIVAQLKYDFGDLREYVSENNITSFSVVAVSRFWELILVGMINNMIFYFSLSFVKDYIKSENEFKKYFTITNFSILLLNTLFLIFSASQRLYLYISTYGFTHKRFDAYTFLPILAVISVLLFASLFIKNYQKTYAISIATFIVYFAVIIMLPTTYIISSINYSSAKNDQIELDPTYTVQVEGRRYYGEEADIEPNDIQDSDGLLVTMDYLDGELKSKISKGVKADLESVIRRFKIKNNDMDLMEFNFMRWLIKQETAGRE